MHNKTPSLLKAGAEKRSRHTAGVLDAYRSHMRNKRPQTEGELCSLQSASVREEFEKVLGMICIVAFFNKLDLESILIEAMSRWCFILSCCFCDLPAKFAT